MADGFGCVGGSCWYMLMFVTVCRAVYFDVCTLRGSRFLISKRSSEGEPTAAPAVRCSVPLPQTLGDARLLYCKRYLPRCSLSKYLLIDTAARWVSPSCSPHTGPPRLEPGAKEGAPGAPVRHLQY